MGIVSIVIACFALIISVAVFVRDNHRYHIPLEMRVATPWVLWNKDNQSLVLLRLIFVNHSLSGRTVVKVEVSKQVGITATGVAWEYDKDYQNVTVRLPNHEKSMPFPIPEVLHDALDIPPHQSQSKWAGFAFHLPQNDEKSVQQMIPIHLAAFDVNDRMLAMVRVDLTLSELRTVGIYPTANRVFDIRGVHKVDH